MAGELFIIATPIGNLDDITIRAVDSLKSVDLLYAEDKRVSANLLNHFEIKVPELRIYNQHSSDNAKEKIAEELILGKKVGLVTDAGTPGISDPGNELIEFLYSRIPDLKVTPIPGVTALTTVLSISGINTNKFVFIGFLPKKKRVKLFTWIKEGKMPFAFYESPNRILKTLLVIKDHFGNVSVVVGRELTKMHETVYRGKVDEVLLELQKSKVKGEIVVIVNP